MNHAAGQTIVLQALVERLRAGDAAARDELVAAACLRLEHLTRKMLKGFPGVRRWEQTDDVLQNAVLRLCRALEQEPLEDARHFLRLAALQIRRELTDLARRYRGPQGMGANHVSQAVFAAADRSPPEPGGQTHDPRRIAEWAALHEAVEQLPDREREVFELLWYHESPQEAAAELLGVDARTVRRRWRKACLILHAALGGELPK